MIPLLRRFLAPYRRALLIIIALVAAGHGVALLPRILTEGRDLAPLGVALVDETDLRWRAALLWRKGARLSPAARAWLGLGREKLPQGVVEE